MTDETKKASAPAVEDVDDLDDLVDEVAEGFSRPVSPKPAEGTREKVGGEDGLGKEEEEEFARQLAEEMEKLWADLVPKSGTSTKGSEGRSPALDNADMETFLKALGEAGKAESPSGTGDKTGSTTQSPASSSSSSSTSSSGKKSFQEKMEDTMGRLRESSEKASEAASSSSMSDEETLLQEMMRHMEEMAGEGGLGAGEEGGGGLDKLMEGMMNQLMTREVLYEPMRDLATRYPAWLQDKKGSLSEEEYNRYKEQLGHIQAMVAHFESTSAQDESSSSSDKQDPVIADLMEKMQDCGQPPSELLQDLAPGMEMDEDGMPQPGNCTLM
ncbi:MAG: Pex19 protein [Piptocephalis tieghemiana]|nr:MAG: Pex19 protein [Piptocephalis tieghemiana]